MSEFAKPVRSVYDKRGDLRWNECSGCGRRVRLTDRECLCGVALLGRVGEVWEGAWVNRATALFQRSRSRSLS